MGNFFTIRDVLQKYHGMAMRWFLVNTQYRAPMNYSQQALEDASARLYYLTETLARSNTMIAESGAPRRALDLNSIEQHTWSCTTFHACARSVPSTEI